MATVTAPGRDLANRVARYYFGGRLPTITEEETFSLINRQAVTYSRIQEVWCNVDMSDRQWLVEHYESKEARIEHRIATLVDSLPEATDPTTGEGFRFTVQFDGDPRGWTVRLIGLNGREVGIA